MRIFEPEVERLHYPVLARRLLARGQMTPGEVEGLTELPLAEVEELAAELSAQRCPLLSHTSIVE